MRSIDVVVRELCTAATEGRQKATLEAAAQREGDTGGDEQSPRRRSSRSQFRADGAADAAPAAEESAAPADASVSTEASGT
jgi:hypothetical protein